MRIKPLKRYHSPLPLNCRWLLTAVAGAALFFGGRFSNQSPELLAKPPESERSSARLFLDRRWLSHVEGLSLFAERRRR